MLSAGRCEVEDHYDLYSPVFSIGERKCQATDNKGADPFGVRLSSQSTRHRKET